MEIPYSPVIGLARTLFALQGLKFVMVGEDNVPREGGAVMAINHTGYFDFTYAGLAARKHKRLVRFMAKKSVFGHAVSGPLMRGMKHIPVDRHAGSQSLAQATEAVLAGEIVGIFPEATMSRSFELKAFKTGAARIAKDGRVPILPTALWGSQRVWTKEAPKHLGRSHTTIMVTVGAPLWVGEQESAEEATARLREVMAAQLTVQQAAYPALTGDDLRYLPARLGGTAPTPQDAAAKDHHDMTRTVDKFTRKQS